jgi:TFIIF-interacting CTD phosphatase-like protein
MPRFDKLLVLDLDETLIHCCETPLSETPPDFHVAGFPVYKRPGVEAFLDTCLRWFETAVWTSATPDYAREILSRVLPDLKRLSFLWTRERCTARPLSDGKTTYLKDLGKLTMKGYFLERILIVDDIPANSEKNALNAIRVHPYRGEKADDELPALLNFLETLGPLRNIRQVEKNNWRVRR